MRIRFSITFPVNLLDPNYRKVALKKKSRSSFPNQSFIFRLISLKKSWLDRVQGFVPFFFYRMRVTGRSREYLGQKTWKTGGIVKRREDTRARMERIINLYAFQWGEKTGSIPLRVFHLLD